MSNFDLQPYRKPILYVLGGVFGLWLVHFAYDEFTRETTDDAQVAAHSTVLAAKVGGIIESVSIEENQEVKAGQVLAKIDPRDYNSALAQAEGDRGSLEARLKEAEKTYRRAGSLLKQQAVSQEQFDAAEATYSETKRRLDSAAAKLDFAKLNIEYTEIKAPVDGKLGRKTAETGMVVAPGQALFDFVETNERWVIANFKETQMRDIKIGQPVEIEIDAISGRTFHGKVESFSPSSGTTFALLPPDNATGNFTKIVQRVPIKIVFDAHSIDGFEDRIVPGINAVVSVLVR
jgi:membrane fusion protein (multidrug efflux system)